MHPPQQGTVATLDDYLHRLRWWGPGLASTRKGVAIPWSIGRLDRSASEPVSLMGGTRKKPLKTTGAAKGKRVDDQSAVLSLHVSLRECTSFNAHF